jgi:hypothetical protein
MESKEAVPQMAKLSLKERIRMDASSDVVIAHQASKELSRSLFFYCSVLVSLFHRSSIEEECGLFHCKAKLRTHW